MELSSELLFFYPPFLLPACLLACAAVGMSVLVDSKPLHLCGPHLSENSLPHCLQARRQQSWREELRVKTSGKLTSVSQHLTSQWGLCCFGRVFSMWFPWFGKKNIKEVPLCGSDKWEIHLVTDCLAWAIIRHGCNPLFHWTLQLFSLKYWDSGSEWELIRHRLFLPIPGITLFLSSSPLVLSVLSSGSFVQPSDLYFALFRLLFQFHPPRQGVCCFPESSLLCSITAPFSFLGSQSETSFLPMSRKPCSYFCGSPSFLLYLEFQMSSSCFSGFHSLVFLLSILDVTSSPCSALFSPPHPHLHV